MLAPCLFVVVPVAIIVVASATGSSASPTMLTSKKHHAPAHNRFKNSHAANSTRRMRVKHFMSQRSVDLLGLSLGGLTFGPDGILAASDAYSHTAEKAHSQSAPDGAYRDEAVTGLTTYRDSLGPLKSLLSQLAAAKGLAHYDKSNKYETLLKDIVNASKTTLSDTDDIIEADPLLGPLLGPIVYDIKCILDEILDAVENVTDVTLNWFAPLLRPLILNATKTVCRTVVPIIAELCSPL